MVHIRGDLCDIYPSYYMNKPYLAIRIWSGYNIAPAMGG